jgi:hypothetical protein
MAYIAENPLADLLEGADEIGAFLGWHPRKVRHLAAQGAMPVFRFGDGQVLHARRATLARWLFELDQAAFEAASRPAIRPRPRKGMLRSKLVEEA